MNILVFGATGWIGNTVVREALARGHQITAVVRDAAKLQLQHPHLRFVIGDVTDQKLIAQMANDFDVVVASVSGRADKDNSIFVRAADALLKGLRGNNKTRLLWVGGAGSLEVAPGLRLVDTPQFPEMYKSEALAQADALQHFRNTATTVNWTVLTPAALIEPGLRSGLYRRGGDQLLTDAQGNSRISVDDYAVALVDEIEAPKGQQYRVSVAA